MSSVIFLLTACGSGTDKASEYLSSGPPISAEEQIPVNEHIAVIRNDQPAFSDSSHTQETLGATTSENVSSSMTKPSTSASSASSSTYGASSLQDSITAAVPVNKIALLKWEHPSERANGEYLELEDIAGYELRYSHDNKSYQSLIIQGSKTTSYKLPNMLDGAKVQIAVFDTNGLYSEFVDILDTF